MYKLLILSLLICISCNSTTENESNNADKIIIDQEKYINGKTDNYIIIDASIKKNILTLKIGSSGCDGSSWEPNLVASTNIGESLPLSKFGKFILKNEEMCDAYFEKTYQYDLSKITMNEKVVFHLYKYEDTFILD